MSLSTTSGIPDVPDGLALWTDDDGCKNGCYIDVGLSDDIVVSGTVNQADFVLQMYDENCQPTNCYSSSATVWDTESYYNGTDDTGSDASWWYDAKLSGTAEGSAATEMYLTVLKESALGAIRQSGVFNDLTACMDGFTPGLDPDASSGCMPHENRYGFMSGQVKATLYDSDKDEKAKLTLTFNVEKVASGFCQIASAIGRAVSIVPFSTTGSTAFGAANYLVGLACE